MNPLYDYTECDEVADNMSMLSKDATFDDYLKFVAAQMPGENKAGTIVNNVAWSLYQRSWHYWRAGGTP